MVVRGAVNEKLIYMSTKAFSPSPPLTLSKKNSFFHAFKFHFIWNEKRRGEISQIKMFNTNFIHNIRVINSKFKVHVIWLVFYELGLKILIREISRCIFWKLQAYFSHTNFQKLTCISLIKSDNVKNVPPCSFRRNSSRKAREFSFRKVTAWFINN